GDDRDRDQARRRPPGRVIGLEGHAAAERLNLRALAIGTDPDLAKPANNALGDAHQRQLKYASILADYHMLVRTVGGRRSSRCWGAGFTVHATASPNRASFPLDAFRLGGRL